MVIPITSYVAPTVPSGNAVQMAAYLTGRALLTQDECQNHPSPKW